MPRSQARRSTTGRACSICWSPHRHSYSMPCSPSSIHGPSRDLEDIAGLHKRLAYWGVKIVTLADGEVGKLHVGLKGIIASIYLDDLAQKTRRGLSSAVCVPDASLAASATVTTLSPPARTAGSGRSTRRRPGSSGGSSASMSMAARPWRLRGG